MNQSNLLVNIAMALDTLRQLTGPVVVTAYATTMDARYGDLRALPLQVQLAKR